MKARNRRIRIAVATTVAAVAVFSVAGGVGLAGGVASLHQYGPGVGQYQYGKHKVTICHKGKRTIRISVRAWPAHKRHGDTEGQCVNGKKRHGKEKGDREHGKSGEKAEHGNKPAETQKSEGGNGKSNGRGNNK